MLLKQLSDEDKRTFLCLAELLSLSDKPILWDGKRRESITKDTNLALVTIQRDEREAKAVEELSSILPDKGGSTTLGAMLRAKLEHRGGIELEHRGDIELALIKRIEKLPLHSQDDPVVRVNAATGVLREVLKNKGATMPSVPKLMLFELMMLALTGGSISNIKWQVLTEFKHHYQLEDYIFRDLLERAQSSYLEAQKTVAIIFE